MTAVQWFYQRILAKDIKEVFEQAKEMEKQQIIDAYANAVMKENNSDYVGMHEQSSGEIYYTSTYGSKGSDETKNDMTKCGIIDNIDYWQKTLEYWKKEKELAIIGSYYYGNCIARIAIIEDFFKSIQLINTTYSQTEISDEEIEKAAMETMDYVYLNPNDSLIFHQGWMRAIKWYREQLKQL